MKKSLLAIALAVATMPLTFAQATPAKPATSGSGTQAATTAKTTKHVRKSKKAPKKNSGATAANPSK